MNREVYNKLNSDQKYLKFLRENSNYYKELNRGTITYEEFVSIMKKKYKLRAIDKFDNVVDTVDIVTKIISISK